MSTSVPSPSPRAEAFAQRLDVAARTLLDAEVVGRMAFRSVLWRDRAREELTRRLDRRDHEIEDIARAVRAAAAEMRRS